MSLLILATIYGVVAASLGLCSGYAGQLSLGQVALLAPVHTPRPP